MRRLKIYQLYLGAAALLCLASPSGSSSIVGGKPITVETTPWQLWAGNCGSSWIGTHWVITANHCIEGSVSNPTRVGYCAGITNRSECTSANKVMAKKIYQAPGQNGLNQDVSLVELQSDITAVKARPIRPISKAQVALGLEKPGVAAYMSGWGGTSASNGSLPQQLQGLDTKIGNSTRATFISVNKPGAGLCPGDSGGPLVVKDENGNWVLVGAASYITGPCGDNTEDFFGRVSAHIDWINATTGPIPVGVNPAHTIAPKIQLAFENGKLVFRADASLDARVTVHALNGKVLFEKKDTYAAGSNTVNFNPVAGTYLVKVEGKDFRQAEMVKTAEMSF